ncbi:MAG: hypothetical protein K6F56_00390 [Oscillospiraceae bacterium]|nr:hypothetical protein [Oscillospiraceae bacterium]
MEKTAGLSERLARLRPEELPGFLAENRDALITDARPFAAYMRAKFREKGVLQQNVFLAADMSENYGYKLIAEEKHTVRRDTILRLCLAAGFNADETREALILYGMAPLHERLPRDVVFLVTIRSGIRDVHRVNELLLDCGLAPLVRESE